MQEDLLEEQGDPFGALLDTVGAVMSELIELTEQMKSVLDRLDNLERGA